MNLNEPTNYGLSTLDISCTELSAENIMGILYNRHQLEPMAINDVRIMYMDLDRVIKQCRFEKTKRKVLAYIMSGYSYEDVAEQIGWYVEKLIDNHGNKTSRPNKEKVVSTFKSICKDIYNQNQTNYMDFMARKIDINCV